MNETIATPEDAQIQFVLDKLQQNKVFFSRQSIKSKRAWVLIRTATILLSGAVTVILGLKASPWVAINTDLTANIALVLSAFAAFLAAAEAAYDFRWTWINYTLTMTRLYGLEDNLQYKRAAGEVTQEDLDAVFAEFSDTLAGVNEKWSKRRMREGGAAKAS
ncbi:SLATT domain-containing protein [Roseovarius sp. M141]|uniref:SLATT domain-containing protein n=1 Tax=Roseovarius sp. M141 TaxID=2583806 RepID=UPI0020CDEE9F|nr:SLATT domain-containing protein [Roseovarius sp. M141]MCQ0092920.1 SLATT domain-containing protein [Roseovarius sp. M141]